METFCLCKYFCVYISLYSLCVCVCKVGILNRGWPKVLFSIDSTPRCRGERYFFPWIAPLYPWSEPYNSVEYHFWVLGMNQPGIESRVSRAIGEHSTTIYMYMCMYPLARTHTHIFSRVSGGFWFFIVLFFSFYTCQCNFFVCRHKSRRVAHK